MRILANENMPSSVVASLRELGHDVLYAKELMPGADDTQILARAEQESRVLITQDKDFGELAFRFRLTSNCGIVLFRLTNDDPDFDLKRMLTSIESRSDWAGSFSVVDDTRIRMRPLPSKSDES